MSLKCFFGHKWKEYRLDKAGNPSAYLKDHYRICQRCGKKQWAWQKYGKGGYWEDFPYPSGG